MSATKEEIEQIVQNAIQPINSRLNKIDNRLNNINGQMIGINQQITSIKNDITQIEVRLGTVERMTISSYYALRGFIEENGYDYVDMWNKGQQSVKNLHEKNQQNPNKKESKTNEDVIDIRASMP